MILSLRLSSKHRNPRSSTLEAFSSVNWLNISKSALLFRANDKFYWSKNLLNSCSIFSYFWNLSKNWSIIWECKSSVNFFFIALKSSVLFWYSSWNAWSLISNLYWISSYKSLEMNKVSICFWNVLKESLSAFKQSDLSNWTTHSLMC